MISDQRTYRDYNHNYLSRDYTKGDLPEEYDRSNIYSRNGPDQKYFLIAPQGRKFGPWKNSRHRCNGPYTKDHIYYF